MQGGEWVTLHGSNLGPMGVAFDTPDAYIVYGSGGRTFTASNCTGLTPSTSTLPGSSQQTQCLSAPGVGRNLTWTVTRKSLTSAPFLLPGAPSGGSASQYTAPAITAVVPPAAPLRTRGQQTVVLRGTNFGPAGYEREGRLVVTYGPLSEQGAR